MTVDPPESRQPPFVAAARKHLHAHANPENRLALLERCTLERRAQAGAIEALHGPIERAYAWQHDSISLIELLGRRCELRRDVEPLVDVADGRDVADPVIDD